MEERLRGIPYKPQMQFLKLPVQGSCVKLGTEHDAFLKLLKIGGPAYLVPVDDKEYNQRAKIFARAKYLHRNEKPKGRFASRKIEVDGKDFYGFWRIG